MIGLGSDKNLKRYWLKLPSLPRLPHSWNIRGNLQNYLGKERVCFGKTYKRFSVWYALLAEERPTWLIQDHQGSMLYHRGGISGAWVWPRICLTDWQAWPQAPSNRFLHHASPHSGGHGVGIAWASLKVFTSCCGKPSICGGEIWMWRH